MRLFFSFGIVPVITVCFVLGLCGAGGEPFLLAAFSFQVSLHSFPLPLFFLSYTLLSSFQKFVPLSHTKTLIHFLLYT